MKSTKIYIIDDNEAVCNSLKFLFESYYDCNIITFMDPILFLNQLSPDYKGCIIVDLFMPCLNGLNLLKELKHRNCNMSVIVISGHGGADVAAQSLAAGAFAFISKPIELDRLLEIVNTILQINQ